jgi:4'-phosphopantetheinyl transferase
MVDPLPLPQDEVHLWYVQRDEVTEPSLLKAYMAILTPEEEARRARYYFEKHRLEYLLTRALCRGVLSRYADVAPEAWAFTANRYGRPEIASPEGSPLRFNLTNTEGLIACLVAREREIGIDVEDTERNGETVAIADRFFSALEVAALRAVPEALQRARFFDYWTLKEAYIKARGMGLSIPLNQFSFELDPGKPIRISFDPALGDDPETWQFAQRRVGPRHLISAAVRRAGEPDLRFVVRRTIPLLPASEVIEEGMMMESRPPARPLWIP